MNGRSITRRQMEGLALAMLGYVRGNPVVTVDAKRASVEVHIEGYLVLRLTRAELLARAALDGLSASNGIVYRSRA